MKLKLKESIRANGVQHLPPSVIDTEEIGISDAEAEVLVRRGTAEVVEPEAPADEPAAEAPAPAPAAKTGKKR